MELSTILSVLGSLASILGAIFALSQAAKSKKSADKAQEIKEELANFTTTSELTEFKQIILAARDALDKYCTTTTESLVGASKGEDAKLVQKVINKVAELDEYFPDGVINNFKKAAEKELKKFVDASESDIDRKTGRNIHREVNDLYGLLTRILKDQQMKVVN